MTDDGKCRVEGCNGPVLNSPSQLCSRHYQRWRRNGSTKRRRERAGAAMQFILSITDSQDACLIWPFGTDGYGYGYLRDGSRMTRSHVFVCKRFHGQKHLPNLEVAHSCGNPACVNPRHLRWATRTENQHDRLKHGTDSRGEKHSNARLSRQDIEEIRDLRGGLKQSEIAEQFGVSSSHICEIQKRRKWKHV